LLRIDRIGFSSDHRIMKGILHIGTHQWFPVETLGISLVICEKKFREFTVRPLLKSHLVLTHHGMDGRNCSGSRNRDFRFYEALLTDLPPSPGIPVPEGREKNEIRLIRPPVADRDFDQDVFDRPLRILHLHIEVAVLIKDARVDKLVLRLKMRTTSILGY
jgi:hypothetical protein